MALSRKARIWLIVLSIPIVLLLAAAIALKAFFSSDKLKAMVVPRVEEATGRDVAVNDISLSIFPRIGVEVEGMTIANREGRGFTQDRPFVALERLDVDMRLWPLLKGNVEIDRISLTRPQILVEINEEGVSNYADMAERAAADTAAVPAEKGEGGVPAGFILAGFEIEDGQLEYIDRKGNSALTVEGLNSTLSASSAEGGVLRTEGKASVERLSYGAIGQPLISNLHLALDHRLAYDQQKDLLTVEQGRLAVHEMELGMTGTASHVSRDTMDLDLTIQSDKINIAELLSLVPKEYMKKAEGLKGSGTVKISVGVKGPLSDSLQPEVSGEIHTAGARLQYANLPRPITDIVIDARFLRTKTAQEFHVGKFSANLGGNPIAATMDVVNFDDPSVNLAVQGTLNLAEVGQYYPLEEGTQLAGMLTSNVKVAGKVRAPAAMKASGTMGFQNVTIKSPASKSPVENLRGTITFNNQVIEAKDFAMKLGRSDMALGFRMQNYLSLMSDAKDAPKATADLALRSNHLYTADIMSEADTTSAAPAGGQKQQRSAMALPDVIMNVNATIGTLTMEKFEFKNVRAAVRVAEGIITMQNFSLQTFGGTVATKGTLNLRNPAQPVFDLAMDMKGMNARSMLSPFTSFGQRLDGTLGMTTSLRGALNDTLGLIPQTLNGQGNVQMAEGQMTGVKVNQAVASLLKLPDLENITFKDWSNSFSVADGRLVIKDLKIRALNADYVINGSQGLDGSLDYGMSLLLPEKTSSRINIDGFAGQAVNLFKDDTGRLKLDFAVGGTMDDPKVRLNTDAAKQKAESMARQKVAEEAKKVEKKVEEEVKKKAGNVLKDIFKKK